MSFYEGDVTVYGGKAAAVLALYNFSFCFCLFLVAIFGKFVPRSLDLFRE